MTFWGGVTFFIGGDSKVEPKHMYFTILCSKLTLENNENHIFLQLLFYLILVYVATKQLCNHATFIVDSKYNTMALFLVVGKLMIYFETYNSINLRFEDVNY